MKKIFNRILNAVSVLKSLICAQEISFQDIEIKGSPEFRQKIFQALTLLKERTPEAFEAINKYIPLIIEGRKTMLSLQSWGSALCLSADYFNETSLTWLASVLAYEGFTANLYSENLKKCDNYQIVSRELYSGRKVWDFQYKCLQSLGAQYEELKHLADFIEVQEPLTGRRPAGKS